METRGLGYDATFGKVAIDEADHRSGRIATVDEELPFEIKSLAGIEIASNSAADSRLSRESGNSVVGSTDGSAAREVSALRERARVGIQGMKPSAEEP